MKLFGTLKFSNPVTVPPKTIRKGNRTLNNKKQKREKYRTALATVAKQ
jgi:hypothetical protein